jgi:hypothetical protein
MPWELEKPHPHPDTRMEAQSWAVGGGKGVGVEGHSGCEYSHPWNNNPQPHLLAMGVRIK